MQYAHSHLAPLGTSPQRAAFVERVVALVAYPDPAQSPLAALLERGQREAAADAVNAALLLLLEGGGGSAAGWSPGMPQVGMAGLLWGKRQGGPGRGSAALGGWRRVGWAHCKGKRVAWM